MATSSVVAVKEEFGNEEEQWKGLVQFLDGRLLFAPLSNSVKIKYTCIAVSSSHVILGANSGGVYCFDAGNFNFTRLLANREGSVSLLGLSPSDNRLLAVVAGGHNVCFWEHNLNDVNTEAKRFHVSSILRDGLVTDMVWDGRGTRLFYGDNQGRIAIAYVPKFARKFGSSSLFKRVDEIIHVEKGAIVQLDMWQDLLLVSTNERCCILKLQGEAVESLILVGARALRNGSFGACFYPRANDRPPIVYSARPRGRLWAANIAGDVISTVKPKEFVVTNTKITPPSTIINTSASSLSLPPSTYTLPSFSFHQLGVFAQEYLITWQQDALFIQKFHESSFSVKTWLSHFQNIARVVCCDNKLYVLHDNCQSVTCLSYLNMIDALISIVEFKNYSLTCEMLMAYNDIVKVEVPMSVITKIVNFVMEYKKPISAEVQELIALVTFEKGNEPVTSSIFEEDTDGIPPSPIEETAHLSQESINVESSQFSMEGSEDPPVEQIEPSNVLNDEEENEAPSTDKLDSSPHTFPNVSVPVKYVQENGHSLPHIDNQTEISIPFISSPPSTVNTVPPLTARMSGEKLKEEEEDLVVVRSISREKRRKSKSGRKKRGSVELSKGFTQTSLLSLEDIIEGEDTLGTAISPSQLSSTAASVDNSPHTSLPSSPPKPFDTTQQQPVGVDTVSEVGSPKTSRSLSWDAGSVDEVNDKPFRSLSQSFEPDMLRPTKILSKVKSMASSQDGSIQKTGRIVKGLLLSSISSTPVAAAPGTYESRSSPEVGESFEDGSRRSSYKSPSPLLSPPPQPVIDDMTKKFIEATDIAMHSLNTPQIICSPSNLKKTLSEWVKELVIYHTHFVRKHQQVLNSVNFLPQDVSTKESVNELICLCLDMQVYPDIINVVPILPKDITNVPEDVTTDTSNVTTNHESNDPVVAITGCEDAIVKGIADPVDGITEPVDVTSEPIDTTSPDDITTGPDNITTEPIDITTGPDIITTEPGDITIGPRYPTLHPVNVAADCLATKVLTDSSGLEITGAVSAHVTIEPIVQSVEIHKEIVNSTVTEHANDGGNPYEAFLRHYSCLLHENDIKHCLDRQSLMSSCMGWRIVASSASDIEESNSSLSPSMMWRLYLEDRNSLVSLCLQEFPRVQPWELIALCQMDLPSIDSQDFDTYLNYTDLLFSDTLKDETLIHVDDVVLMSVTAALRVTPTDPVKKDNGQPLPNGHLVKWPHETSLTGLSSYCKEHCSDGSCLNIIELFGNAGYWKGYLELSVWKKMKDKVWGAVSSLCNYSLLHNLVKKGHIFDTPLSWQSFMTLLSQEDLPIEAVSEEDLWNWETIIREMISIIGVDESMKILQCLNLQCNLPYSIHQLLIGLTSLHREQRTIAHNLLEKFDRYLWSVRPNSLGPYLLNVYQREDDEDSNKEEILREVVSPPPGSHPNIPNIFMEDATSHWGIKSCSTECMVCGFSVIMKMSDKEGGAIAFRCGHIYHRQCLPEQACVICFVKNYRTSLSFHSNR